MGKESERVPYLLGVLIKDIKIKNIFALFGVIVGSIFLVHPN
jgi:hypothetical protein